MKAPWRQEFCLFCFLVYILCIIYMCAIHLLYIVLLLLLLPSRFSRVRLCAIAWTAAYQAPLSMGFSRQEYWSGLPLSSWYIVLYICIYGKIPWRRERLSILVFLPWESHELYHPWGRKESDTTEQPSLIYAYSTYVCSGLPWWLKW